MSSTRADDAAVRQRARRDAFDRIAANRAVWMARNGYFYEDDRRYMRFLVPPGATVLDLGCGLGDLLAAVEPARGVGVDFSPAMLDHARRRHPELTFVEGDIEDPDTFQRLASAGHGAFDYIVLSDAVGNLDDCQRAFENLHAVCGPDTRIVVAYFSQAWRPLLRAAELLRQKMPQPPQNWLAAEDIEALLRIAGFEPVKREWRLLVPRRLGGLGSLVNRTLGTLPGVRRLALRHYVVARSVHSRSAEPSASVVVPCRNEAGNIAPLIERLPSFSSHLEIVFVEGHSSDGTLAEIERVARDHPELDIRVLEQDGRGKGDAVRKGFAAATGDILMILDADLTVPPEDLPKFYRLLADGTAEYAHGTRLVYPMSGDAMRPLNNVANHLFARIFSWLLNQRITDTLCGTKVLWRRHYCRIIANRSYFGDFDPFGDFDLIFGASLLSLKIVELPIRYDHRRYGTTQISRFRDGLLLLRMVVFAFRKLKAV